MHSPIITLRDVSVRYDSDRPAILQGINLVIDHGSFTAITGPNGGGKTTLLRVILRLQRPTTGLVTYLREGKPVKNLHVGYLPQKSMIDTRFPITVREVIASGLLHSFMSKVSKAHSDRIDEIMHLCGVTAIASQSIGTLSGGQLQRTLLGRAIISSPELLVLDEPLSYVDKEFEHQIYGIIEQLAKTSTILLVSHEMGVISGMASRHLIVDHGLHACHALHHYTPSPCQ